MRNNLKAILKNKLTKKEISLVPSSFDIVGNIMIFSDFPKELEKKEKIIGKEILNLYKNVKTVAKKTKKYSGKYRLPKIKIISGEKTKETVHKENNIGLKLDVKKAYFSPRMATERLRIARLIKPNESVLVMFSGIAPYLLVIAKNSKAKEIYGIEINPVAHKYALENVKKNKLENKIKLFLGDVKKIVPKLKKRFDRILMPLPKGAENFLDTAFKASKRNTTIHFYDFLHENEFNKAEKKIDKACKKNKIKYKILKIIKCGQFSPRKYRICVDFKVY